MPTGLACRTSATRLVKQPRAGWDAMALGWTVVLMFTTLSEAGVIALVVRQA
jgi:hypothetical protein